jgi:hypothetical protein
MAIRTMVGGTIGISWPSQCDMPRGFAQYATAGSRVSFETSFDSKQLKLEPKLVLKLSETRLFFPLFRLNIETGSFGVSIEPKQKENNRNKPEKVLKLL